MKTALLPCLMLVSCSAPMPHGPAHAPVYATAPAYAPAPVYQTPVYQPRQQPVEVILRTDDSRGGYSGPMDIANIYSDFVRGR